MSTKRIFNILVLAFIVILAVIAATVSAQLDPDTLPDAPQPQARSASFTLPSRWEGEGRLAGATVTVETADGGYGFGNLVTGTYTVSGTVTDAAAGWPLYASIEISGYMHNETIWTNPVDGQYTVTLAGAPSAYDFTVRGWVDGYEAATRSVGPLASDGTEDFVLDADARACSAPGYTYASEVYTEDFEAGGVYTFTGDWEWGAPSVWPNRCGSGDNCWGTNMDDNYSNNMSAMLTSTVISLTGYPTGTVLFANWQQAWFMEEGYDYAIAEVSINGGDWEMIWWSSTLGDWTEMDYGISDAAGGTVQFRWRLTSDSAAAFPGYYVDDVKITEGCVPTPGGLVVGNVYDQDTSSPQAGVVVQSDSGDSFTATATPDDPAVDDAFYTLFSLAGAHTFTATSIYGYSSDVESVSVAAGDTIEQDFALPSADTYVLEGVVTDAATGWPLYAGITINGYPGDPIWNDPVTGYYSVTLAEGGPYNVAATTWVGGYDTVNAPVASLTGDTTLNLEADANLAACNAPGYVVLAGVRDGGFELGTPNPYWNEYSSSGYPSLIVNYYPHSGNFSVWFGYRGPYAEQATLDQDLTVPADATTLSFWLVIGVTEPISDVGYLTVTLDSTVVFTANQDDAATYGDDYTQVTLDISAFADGNVHHLQFDEMNPAGNPGDIFFVVDDVATDGVTCIAPPSGGLVVGNVYDANTADPLNNATVANEDGYSATSGATADAAVEEGFYTIFSPAGAKTFTATLGNRYGTDAHTVTVSADTTVGLEDFDLPAAVPGSAQTSLSVVLSSGETATQTLTLSNTGDLPVDFTLVEWQPAANPTTARRTSFRLPKSATEATFARDLGPERRFDGVRKPSRTRRPLATGDVLNSWDSGLTLPWGVVYDRMNGTVWVGSPCVSWGGDCQIVEYATDGAPTGRWYGFPWGPVNGPADMAYNSNTGMIWVVDVTADDCIHELDPDRGWTGDTICGFAAVSMRGLAYNAATDVFYTGRWTYGDCPNGTVCQAIHQFGGETWDHPGEIITTTPLLGVEISGLAYHPDTETMFVVTGGISVVRQQFPVNPPNPEKSQSLPLFGLPELRNEVL